MNAVFYSLDNIQLLQNFFQFLLKPALIALCGMILFSLDKPFLMAETSNQPGKNVKAGGEIAA